MLQQNYSRADHATWAYLMGRADQYLGRVNKEYLDGWQQLQLPENRIPYFHELNDKLAPLTGWQYTAAPGIVSMEDFLIALSRKQFLSSVDIRPEDELDFCKLPDIFHDVFGHAALLANRPFCDFLEALGRLSVQYAGNGYVIQYLANIYWYTAEVGLVMEGNELKYYGGSIVSSISEINTVYSDHTVKHPFAVNKVGATSYDSYAVNDVYFVVPRLSALNDCLNDLELACANQLEAQRS